MKTTLSTGEPLPTTVPDRFLTAYTECALWSSTYETEDREDNYMDDGEHELAPETVDQFLADCADFLSYCGEINLDPFPDYGMGDEYTNQERSGHDFWLTRNHHGAGYWDRGLETGKQLTDAAHTFGSVDLYIGDDGLIYQA